MVWYWKKVRIMLETVADLGGAVPVPPAGHSPLGLLGATAALGGGKVGQGLKSCKL